MKRIPNVQQKIDEHPRERIQYALEQKQLHRQRLEMECRLRAVLQGKPLPPEGRLRLPGGGRKSLLEKYPDLIPALHDILTPPQTAEFVPPIQWTTLTDKEIVGLLRNEGVEISASSFSSVLYRSGLRAHPTVRIPKNRPSPKDTQFDFINRLAGEALRHGQRVHFVDFHIDDDPESSLAHYSRCKIVIDLIIGALEHLWYDLKGGNSCPLIVVEGGTLLGIANKYFHPRLEKLANDMDFNALLLSYLPTGISRWTHSERIYENSRKFTSEHSFEEAFVTVDDIQMEPRLPSITGGAPALWHQFRDESEDLGLCDWNRTFGERRSDDAPQDATAAAADPQPAEIIQK